MIDGKKLQSHLGVSQDGDIGRVTFTALYKRLGASQDIAEELALASVIHLPAYGIMDNDFRFAQFFAQTGHESGGFKYMKEIASGSAYEGRADLGNTQPGDGMRYKGRGPIQITGRANYRKYGRLIGIDIERHPEVAETPSIGLHLACEYWKQTGLNSLADVNDTEGVTRRINGGLNGLMDRKQRLIVVKGLLA